MASDNKNLESQRREENGVVYFDRGTREGRDGRKYDRIAEYVMWYDGSGNRRLSCGVITNNCIMRVPADKVEPAEVTE